MAYRSSNCEPPASYATRLSHACRDGDLPRVQSIIDEMQHHPPSDMHEELNRAAFAAAVDKHAHVLQFLLENGASVTGGSSLLAAASQFPPDTAILQVMYDHGWDAEHINKDMSRDVMGLEKAMSSKPFTEWLLDHGMDPNLKGKRGPSMVRGDMTPMNAAALDGRKSEAVTKTMDLLLSRGATVDPTVLMNAISWRNHGKFYPKVLQWLVDHGADVNCTMQTGARLLKAAISDRNAALVQFLLDNGAETDHLGEEMLLDDDEQQCEGFRGSALEYAREIEANEICNLLENNARPTSEGAE
ncbi:ankyrin [Apiospora rasikravindrae]|uniref:Ankyrin n=1 Tax=Apiospora rasikravindrae TaxID=990691 RepID=A0ABR1RPP1_9PEZI